MSLHGNLLGPEPTRLPVDPAVAKLAAGADAVLAASVFHFGLIRIGEVKASLRDAQLEVR